jgi:ketosteroid isomerase-like protein
MRAIGALYRVYVVVLTLSFLPALGVGQDADMQARDAALRALTDKYFAAYTRKDLETVLALYSAGSPDLAANKKTLQQLFADTDRFDAKNLVVGKVAVNGSKASVSAAIEIAAADVKTGKPAAGLGKMNLVLRFVKEGVVWKINSQSSATEDLMRSLLAAGSDDESRALLLSEKEFVTAELRQSLMRQGNSFLTQGNYVPAMADYRLALAVAEQIGDKPGIAGAIRTIDGQSCNQA